MCVGENATEALIKGLRTFEHICDVIGDRYEKALNQFFCSVVYGLFVPFLAPFYYYYFIQQTSSLSHIIKHGSFSCSFSASFSSSSLSSSSASSSASSASPMNQTDMSIPSRHHFDQSAQQLIAENASRILRLSSRQRRAILVKRHFQQRRLAFLAPLLHYLHIVQIGGKSSSHAFLSAYLKIILH